MFFFIVYCTFLTFSFRKQKEYFYFYAFFHNDSRKKSCLFEFLPGDVGAGYDIYVGGESVVGQAVLPRNVSAFGKPKLRSLKNRRKKGSIKRSKREKLRK
jgi:hypothetical protein